MLKPSDKVIEFRNLAGSKENFTLSFVNNLCKEFPDDVRHSINLKEDFDERYKSYKYNKVIYINFEEKIGSFWESISGKWLAKLI